MRKVLILAGIALLTGCQSQNSTTETPAAIWRQVATFDGAVTTQKNTSPFKVGNHWRVAWQIAKSPSGMNVFGVNACEASDAGCQLPLPVTGGAAANGTADVYKSGDFYLQVTSGDSYKIQVLDQQ